MPDFDDAIRDLKDELLVSDPAAALSQVAEDYGLTPASLRFRAEREIGELSTYAERVGASQVEGARAREIVERTQRADALDRRILIDRLAAIFTKK